MKSNIFITHYALSATLPVAQGCDVNAPAALCLSDTANAVLLAAGLSAPFHPFQSSAGSVFVEFSSTLLFRQLLSNVKECECFRSLMNALTVNYE